MIDVYHSYFSDPRLIAKVSMTHSIISKYKPETVALYNRIRQCWREILLKHICLPLVCFAIKIEAALISWQSFSMNDFLKQKCDLRT